MHVSGCSVASGAITVLFFCQGVLAGLCELGVPRSAAASHGRSDGVTWRGGRSRGEWRRRWGALSCWSLLLFDRCHT